MLQERLKNACEEYLIAKQLLLSQAEEETKKNNEKWSERQKNVDDVWDAKREDMMQAIIVHAAPAVTPRCQQCHMETTICVRCASCKEVLCFECDFSYHRTRPFHTRQCMQLDSSFPLKPTQFLDPSGNIFDKCIQCT